jgi:hypothetical protein
MRLATVLDRAQAAWKAGDMPEMGRYITLGLKRWPAQPTLNSLWAEWRLLLGDWSKPVWETWHALRWRLANPRVQADYRELRRCWPEWDGLESLAPDPIKFPDGVPIFVWNDGGHGDIVCFARFLPLLEAQGAKVIWQARGDLMPGWETGKLAVACFVCLQSLPGVMGLTPDTIPPPARFLFPKPEGQRWPPRRIACVWEGNPEMGNDVFRSIYAERPEHWREQLPFEWVDLPKGGDWQPSVEILRRCDLLITVDTGPMHVAATLGIPVWCLLGTMHYPIYLADGSGLERWYPGIRIFRQRRPQVWEDVITDVERELRALIAQREVAA